MTPPARFTVGETLSSADLAERVHMPVHTSFAQRMEFGDSVHEARYDWENRRTRLVTETGEIIIIDADAYVREPESPWRLVSDADTDDLAIIARGMAASAFDVDDDRAAAVPYATTPDLTVIGTEHRHDHLVYVITSTKETDLGSMTITDYVSADGVIIESVAVTAGDDTLTTRTIITEWDVPQHIEAPL